MQIGTSFGPAGVFHDRVTVTMHSGRARYRMTPFPVAATPVPADAARTRPGRLLAPDHQVVPFAGRDADLADLADWLGGEAPLAARLVHAGGGQGKSRLAGQLAGRCAGADWEVWRASHAAGRADVPEPVGDAVLLVVDYADRWPASDLLDLAAHLHELAGDTGPRVRLLLLARSAGYWWARLRHRLDSDYAIPADARELTPLGDELDRAELFAAASRKFAAALDVPVADLDRPELAGPEFRSVLAVHMAALVAVDAHRRRVAAPREPYAVSAYLLARERALWADLHGRAEAPLRTDPYAMSRAVYVAALTGALPRDAAGAALRAVGLTDVDEVLDDHAACYPPDDPRNALQPLYPDRLAEDFVALSTPGHPYGATDDTGWRPDPWAATAAAHLLGGEFPAWTPAAVTVLVETAHRWEHVAREVLYPLLDGRPDLAVAAGGATLVRLAELPGVPPALLYRVAVMLPMDRHVVLDRGAAAITAALVRSVGERTAELDPVPFGLLLELLAQRQLHAGEDDAAVTEARRAVEVLRGVPDSVAAAPYLASALNTLGMGLLAQGDAVAAERAVQEGLEVARGAPEPDQLAVAMSLGNLGRIRFERGDPSPALIAAEESLARYRALAAEQTDASEPTDATDLTDGGRNGRLAALATALNNVCIVQLGLGRDEPAVGHAGEAVTLLRPLVAAHPATYLPDLARTLGNLAVGLRNLGRHDDALRAVEEAVGTFRQLVEINPAPYQPALVRCLLNLAMHHRQLGQQELAGAAAEEALALARVLAAAAPLARGGDLGISLIELAKHATDAGMTERALTLLDEAEPIVRRCAEAEPTRYRDDLVNIAARRCALLADLGRPTEAAALVPEVVDLVGAMVDEELVGRPEGLAAVLASASLALADKGRFGEGKQLVEAAVGYHRRRASLLASGRDLIDSPPDEVAVALCALSTFGTAEERVTTLREAVDLLRPAAAADPAYRRQLAFALNGLALACVDLPGGGPAVSTAAEAVGILRPLAATQPDTFRMEFLSALVTYAHCCLTTGRSLTGGVAAAEEGLAVFDRLTEDDRNAFAVVRRDLFETRLKLLVRLGTAGQEHLRAGPRNPDGTNRELLFPIPPAGATTTLDRFAADARCSVETARRLLAEAVELSGLVVTRIGRTGPEPVDFRTIASHARFAFVFEPPPPVRAGQRREEARPARPRSAQGRP